MERFNLIPKIDRRSVKRNRTEMYIDVLNVISEGVNKPTRIMYRSNLCWQPLKEILNDLQTLGLIEKKEVKSRNGSRKRSIYLITEDGRRVLKKVNELEMEFIKSFSTAFNPIYKSFS